MINLPTSYNAKWLPFVTIFVLAIGLSWMFSHRMVVIDWDQVPVFTTERLLLVVFVISLMPLNWSLEAIKFRLLLGEKAEGDLGNQLKAVLGGVSLSMFLPNRMGEFTGRLLFLKAENRPAGLSATIVGSSLQMAWITLFGGIALAWSGGIGLLAQKVYLDPGTSLVTIFVALGLLLLLSTLGSSRQFIKASLSHFRISLGLRVVTLGLLTALVRYGLFNVQFGLLLMATGCTLHWIAILQFTTLVYFCQSIIPLPPAVGWIGRLQLAVLVSGLLAVSPAQAILASLTLWTINLLLPGFVGAYFISKSTRYNQTKLIKPTKYAV